MTSDELKASLFPVPATQVINLQAPPKTRKTCCAKCPFGTELTPSEQMQADQIKASLAGRISAGGNVLWGCHETVAGKAPQICAGFAEWVRPRPELE